MKRTFQEASLRGTNKWIIKGLVGVIQKLNNLNISLLTSEELSLIASIKSDLHKLSDNDRFDKAAAELGFKVWRYDLLIIQNGIPTARIRQSSTEYKFWKRQEREGLKIQVTNKYLL